MSYIDLDVIFFFSSKRYTYRCVYRDKGIDVRKRMWVELWDLKIYNEFIYSTMADRNIMAGAPVSRLEYDYLTKKIETDIGIVYGNDLLKGWW